MALTKVTNDLQDALAAAQPTITSTGTLTGLTVSGEITANGGIGVTGNITQTGANSANFLIKAPTDNASLTLQAGSSDSGAEGAFVNFLQNTTSKWQMGMNTDNSFRWYNYATSSEAMQISPSGNVGIGVTPAAFNAASTAVQLSGGHFYDRTIGETYIGNNSYHDSGDVTRAVNTGLASNIGFYSGNTIFQSAASVAAGALSTMVTNMTIDASGRVTQPYQPSFRVGATASFSGNGTIHLHPTSYHDVGNNYAPSNGRFTAPVAGVYYFGAQLISLYNSTTNEQNFILTKNGAPLCDARCLGHGSSSSHLKTVVQLAVGDYICVQNGNGNTATYANAFHNQFCGYLIG